MPKENRPNRKNMSNVELDKAQQPLEPVAWMSEEFVRARAMEIYPPDEVNDGCPWYGHRRAIEDSAARHMVRHLHKMGYLAPAAGLTVEEVMDVMNEWTGDKPDSFRSRLTAALEAKFAK